MDGTTWRFYDLTNPKYGYCGSSRRFFFHIPSYTRNKINKYNYNPI